MKKVLGFGTLAVLITALAIACTKGGSNDSPPAPTDNNNNSSPSFDTTAPAGEPSQMDWARLSARLGGIAVDALTQSTSSSSRSLAGTAAAMSIGPRAIQVPVSNLAISASFICCGETSTS